MPSHVLEVYDMGLSWIFSFKSEYWIYLRGRFGVAAASLHFFEQNHRPLILCRSCTAFALRGSSWKLHVSHFGKEHVRHRGSRCRDFLSLYSPFGLYNLHSLQGGEHSSQCRDLVGQWSKMLHLCICQWSVHL